MLRKITSNNLSPFNIDFILKSSCNFCRHLLYFRQLRYLCSLLRIVLQFRSRHNSHTGHCYVISFAAGERLDVIIRLQCYTNENCAIKLQCYVSCPPKYAKGGGRNFFLAPLAKIPTFKTASAKVKPRK